MTTLPPEVTYARVSGRIIRGVKDAGDADELPDLMPAQGTITFTPELEGTTQYPTLPGVLFSPDPITVDLDSDGAFDEYLISTDNGNWTYRVTFNVQGIVIRPISIHLPGGSTHLITDWIPVGTSVGTPSVRGPAGPSAYELAVQQGFVGTLNEWLASLEGEPGPAGTGAVESVNGFTGVIVLDADDVGAKPSSYVPAWGEVTGKPSTFPSDWTQIANKPSTFPATAHTHNDLYYLKSEVDSAVSTASAADRNRANHTGTQPSTSISDFTEAVQDAVAALLSQGTGISLSYNDAGNSLTISSSGQLDAEAVRDAIGVAMIGTGLITVAVNDAADTITISTTATQNSTDAALRDRSTHTGTQSADTLTDGSTNRLFSTAEKAKLAGVADGATANSTDTYLRSRANHTGTQSILTVAGLADSLNARSFENPTYSDFVYDGDGNPLSWVVNGTIAASATYNPDGTVATYTYNGVTRTYSYNPDGTTSEAV
jgi:hypothetical protein